jgi:hypothetical protein
MPHPPPHPASTFACSLWVYRDSADLRDHYAKEHFLCNEGECADSLVAFPTEAELKAHKLERHSSKMPRFKRWVGGLWGGGGWSVRACARTCLEGGGRAGFFFLRGGECADSLVAFPNGGRAEDAYAGGTWQQDAALQEGGCLSGSGIVDTWAMCAVVVLVGLGRTGRPRSRIELSATSSTMPRFNKSYSHLPPCVLLDGRQG